MEQQGNSIRMGLVVVVQKDRHAVVAEDARQPAWELLKGFAFFQVQAMAEELLEHCYYYYYYYYQWFQRNGVDGLAFLRRLE
jgi:hypothetical protein